MARNILIVDDSLTIRSSLEYCLKEAGFNVVAAVDGIDGIEKLKSMKDSGVCVIITDVNMPRMDGITFTENVKKSSFRSTPVLILTTETQESRKQQGRAAGAAGWLVKPFQPAQLIAVINKVTQ